MSRKKWTEASLMQALMDVVPGVKIAAQHSFKVVADQVVDHFPRTRVMVLVIAHRRRADTPDISVEAIFSPTCLIGLYGRAGADLAQESIEAWLGMRTYPVKQLHDFSQTDLKDMQGVHHLADLPQRQAQADAQVRDHAGQSHANAPLPKHFGVQIDWRFVPFLTSCAPAFENAMFGDLHRGWWGNIDHFAGTSQADATQTQIAIRAHQQMMLHDLRGQPSTTCPIVLGLALLARLLLFDGGLSHIRFYEGRRRRFLLFQFFDPSQGNMQQFLRLLQRFTQFLVFFSQLERFFFCHGLSLSERSSLNSIRDRISSDATYLSRLLLNFVDN